MLWVRDVMGPAVVVRQDTTLRTVASLMLKHHVQGVLVIDEHAEAVGIVTERHLTLDDRYLSMACLQVPEFRGRPVTSVDEVDAARIAAMTLTAHDVMEKRLTCARVDEPVGVVVERMLRRDAEYAVVHESNSVVGMLGGHDLLWRVAGEQASPHPAGGSSVDGQSARLRLGLDRKSVIGWLTGGWR